MNKKREIIILSILGNSGGAIARESLCYNLRKLGYNAKILYPQICEYANGIKDIYIWAFFKHMMTKTIPTIFWKRQLFNVPGCKLKLTPFVGNDTIVVYPEITRNNPLKAKKVVRWFLYYNPLHGQPDAYGQDDLFFTYRPVFNDYDLNPTCRTLTTPYFDLDTYKRTNYGERSGKCYIIRKGKKRADLPKEFDGPVIDDLPEKEKVRLFNQCEWCISYDTQTAYSTIAAMCGCISVVIPEPGKSKADYRTPDDMDLGVAFGFSEEEIEHAIHTRDEIYNYFKSKNEQSMEEVKKFVAICEEYFKDK